jgi:hypothetical protein
MDCVRPIGDHARLEVRKGKDDQPSDDIEPVLNIAQPFDQPPLDDACETMPFEPVDCAVDRLDQLLFPVGPMKLAPVKLLLAAADPFDGIIDLCLGSSGKLRKPRSVAALGFWFFSIGPCFS